MFGSFSTYLPTKPTRGARRVCCPRLVALGSLRLQELLRRFQPMHHLTMVLEMHQVLQRDLGADVALDLRVWRLQQRRYVRGGEVTRRFVRRSIAVAVPLEVGIVRGEGQRLAHTDEAADQPLTRRAHDHGVLQHSHLLLPIRKGEVRRGAAAREVPSRPS